LASPTQPIKTFHVEVPLATLDTSASFDSSEWIITNIKAYTH